MKQGPKQHAEGASPRPITMLDLVFELTALEPCPEQVIARAQHLIRTNRVRLTGTFCDRNQKTLTTA